MNLEMFRAFRQMAQTLGDVVGETDGESYLAPFLDGFSGSDGLSHGKPSTFMRFDWHAREIQKRTERDDV